MTTTNLIIQFQQHTQVKFIETTPGDKRHPHNLCPIIFSLGILELILCMIIFWHGLFATIDLIPQDDSA